MDLKNALEIMGLKAPLTEQQFKKKLRELLRIYHPDHNTKEKQEESEKITKKILEAKEVIENYFENQKQFSDALNYDGVGYQDYLRFFLSQKSEKELLYRFMDLCEMDIRITPGNEYFQMDGCLDMVKAKVNVSSGYGKGYEITRTYGYE